MFARSAWYQQEPNESWATRPTGRLLSEDPIRFLGGVNFYSYVGNNVVNHTDPEGEGVVDCVKALAELAAATANVNARAAAIALHGGKPDPGHEKALSQAVQRLKDALQKVRDHCACYGPLAAEIAAAIAAADEALRVAGEYLSEAFGELAPALEQLAPIL